MGLGRYLVDAVILEGRSVSELARSHWVSRGWIYKLLHRYEEGGYPALEPRSRRPLSCSHHAAPKIETEVLRLRRELNQAGFDAGPQTIRHHLQPLVDQPQPPSGAILKRNQLITPQPQKRPRCSYIRFEAQLPNQTWQCDATPGSSPTAARSRSSISSTTTPDSSSTPPSFPLSRPTTSSRHSSWLVAPTACPPPS